MFRTLLWLSVLLLLLQSTLSSCDRNGSDDPPKPDTLPPITLEGKGTLGCMVNGKLWLPKGGGFYEYRLLGVRGQNYVAFVSHRADPDTTFSLSLFVRGLDSLGTFPMIAYNDEQFGRGGGGDWGIDGPVSGDLVKYYCDSILAGEITLLGLDTTTPNGRYMAGTFWMDMRNWEDSTDIIHIRDGRFDVRLPN